MKSTFTKEQGIIILDYLSSVIQAGVDMYIYFADSKIRILKYEYKNKEKYLNEVLCDNELSLIHEIRKSRKKVYSWELAKDFRDSNVANKKQAFQLNITDELEHFVLLLRFICPYDSNNDVVFIRFRKDLSFIGIEGSEIPFIPEVKTTLANMLYKSTCEVLNSAKNDLSFFESFSKKTMSLLSNVKKNEEDLNSYKDRYERLLLSIVNGIVDDYSKKYLKSFILTNESIEVLKNYLGEEPKLRKIVENAIDYAYNLNFYNNESIISIEKEYFDFSYTDVIVNKSINTEKTTKKESREDRAINMLVKIEYAVRKLIANNEKIIGINVGNEFDPPISAPAITDFLKNYSQEINKILSSDLNMCTESRKLFSPLKNIMIIKAKAS